MTAIATADTCEACNIPVGISDCPSTSAPWQALVIHRNGSKERVQVTDKGGHHTHPLRVGNTRRRTRAPAAAQPTPCLPAAPPPPC